MEFLRSKELKLFLTFFLIFSYFSQWTTWDEESSLALTRAIVEEGKFEINTFHNKTGDRAYYNNNFYSHRMPGLSFLAVPTYSVYKTLHKFFILPDSISSQSEMTYFVRTSQEGDNVTLTYNPTPDSLILNSMFLVTIFTSSLFGALTVLLVYRLSKYFLKDLKHRFFITSIYGLGTLVLTYSGVFLNHIPAIFFTFSGFYLLFELKQKKIISNAYLLLAGLFLGFAIVISPLAIVIAAVCLIYTLSFQKNKILYFLVGGIIGISPLLLYNYSIFGTPFKFTFFYYDQKIWSVFTPILKMPTLHLMLRLTVFPYRGLFFYCPILLLSFVGLYYMYKKFKIESILILVIFFALLIINSSYKFWRGGFCFGPRHLLLSIPFLILPLMQAMEKINFKIVLILFCISAFFNILGFQFWESMILGEDMKIEAYFQEKILKFQIMANPIFDHFFPLFLKNGPRSIFFESIILYSRIDIRNTPHSCGLTPPVLEKIEIFSFVLPSIGIIALKLPFLSLIPLTIMIFLIWRKKIFKKLNLSSKQKLIVITGVIITFVVLYIKVTSLVYGENWYAPEFNDGKIDDGKWMSQNATIKVFNKYQKPTTKTLNFWIESFNTPKSLQIYLNDKLVFKNTIKDKTLVEHQVSLVPGLNEIKFNSVEGCDIPTELRIRDCDLRCLSFRIDNVEIRNLK